MGYRFLTDHYPSAALPPCLESRPNQRLAYQDDRLPHGLEVRGFLGPDLQILQRHHAPVTALLDIDEHTVEIRVESTLIAGRKRAPLPPMAPMRGDSPWDHGAECSLAGSRPPPPPMPTSLPRIVVESKSLAVLRPRMRHGRARRPVAVATHDNALCCYATGFCRQEVGLTFNAEAVPSRIS